MSRPDGIHVLFPSKAQTDDVSVLAGHLNEPIRIRILLALHQAEPTVTDLCDQLGRRRPIVSHHLRRLRLTGVAEPKRRGKFKVYSLTPVGRRLVEAIRVIAG
jgi:ArsR family transcriptional regulator